MFDLQKLRDGLKNNHIDIGVLLKRNTLLNTPLEQVARDVIAKAEQDMRDEDLSEDSIDAILLVGRLQLSTRVWQSVSAHLQENNLPIDREPCREDLWEWLHGNRDLRHLHEVVAASTIPEGSESTVPTSPTSPTDRESA